MPEEVRQPPYPADTRAKGWRFELDYEQIEQSDTWSIAAEVPMAQHALLMMWMVAWSQVPCGSLPIDETVIRAKCRIPPSVWAKCRGVLMRGWWPADDGRMYHDTLVKRVMEMMARRRSDADRQAAKRAREAVDSGGNPPVVTPTSRVTPTGLTPESSTDNRQPNTDTNTNTNTPHKPHRKRRGSAADASLVSVEQMVGDGVTRQHAEEWLAIRKTKNLTLTATAWDDVKAEAAKASLTLGEAIRMAVVNSWGGFKAKWTTDDRGRPGSAPAPARGNTTAEETAQMLAERDRGTGAPPVEIRRQLADLTQRLTGRATA